MKKILVHTCCGPCALMPLDFLLQEHFLPSAYFFNPNIHLQEEYLLRLYAMQEVTKYYHIPLIIQGNSDYYKKLESYQNKISSITSLALSHCTPFLINKNTVDKNEKNWRLALEKILKKWKNYTKEFELFTQKTVQEYSSTKIVSDTHDFLFHELVQVNPSLFITRLAHISHNDDNSHDSHHFFNPALLSKDTLNNSPFQEGERCKKCYQDRLYQSALYASQNAFELFTSTLLYSRYQNHQDICDAAFAAEERVNKENSNNPNIKPIKFYYKDFRKLWQEGIDKSKALNLYRQKWCGCSLSRMESLERMTQRIYDKTNKDKFL